MVDIGWRLAVVLLLVGLNGLFVAAEFALVSVRRTRIEQLIAEGNVLARTVRRAMDDPNRFISAAQLGITMASLGLGWVGEPALAQLFHPVFDALLPENLALIGAHGVAVFFAFATITFLHLVIGEQVPKMMALQRSEVTILLTAPPTQWMAVIFRPLIAIVYWATEIILRLLHLRYEGEKHLVYTVEELEMLVIASKEGGQLAESESEMIHRVFNFADLTAQQVMVPRTEIVAVPTSISFEALVEVVRREGRSRLPIYQESLDDIVGVVHVKDIVRGMHSVSGDAFDVRSIAREVLTAPESLSIDELLSLMKAHRTHIAIVIDEFGGTAGLTTLEDLLEVIVGEVQDEFERPLNDYETLPNGVIRVNGLMLIDDFSRRMGIQIDDPDFDSIGGFIFGRIGHKPELGDEVRAAGLVFRVDALDGLRIARLTVEPEQPVETTATNGHAGQSQH